MVSFAAYMRGTHKWISEAQEKGMKALQLHLSKAGRLTEQNSIWETFSWMIQKDHESQEYMIKLMGDQISRLEDQIKLLQNELWESKMDPTDEIQAKPKKRKNQDD